VRLRLAIMALAGCRSRSATSCNSPAPRIHMIAAVLATRTAMKPTTSSSADFPRYGVHCKRWRRSVGIVGRSTSTISAGARIPPIC